MVLVDSEIKMRINENEPLISPFFENNLGAMRCYLQVVL